MEEGVTQFCKLSKSSCDRCCCEAKMIQPLLIISLMTSKTLLTNWAMNWRVRTSQYSKHVTISFIYTPWRLIGCAHLDWYMTYFQKTREETRFRRLSDFHVADIQTLDQKTHAWHASLPLYGSTWKHKIKLSVKTKLSTLSVQQKTCLTITSRSPSRAEFHDSTEQTVHEHIFWCDSFWSQPRSQDKPSLATP